MNYRELGRIGWKVSTVSYGAWAIGGDWGTVDDKESLAALHAALDHGVNFFDTADNYGDGRSEQLLAQLRKSSSQLFYVATKCGRRLPKQSVQGYSRENITAFVESSLKNLEMDALDLIQLHCPPTDLYYAPEVFGILDDLVKQGKLRHYGVCVERVEEALKAIEYPNVETVQIIFNIFRQRPADLFFAQAQAKRVGILARVPLASGLLSGKITNETHFERNDHRNYNRHGESFDRGETFAGVDFDKGLEAVEELRPLVPPGWSMSQFALRWILMFDAVSCAIPGGKRPSQVQDNCAAADLPSIPQETMARVRAIYEEHIKESVQHLW